MKLFIDSAKIEEIKEAEKLGVLDGITTNPSLIKKAAVGKGKIDMEKYIISIFNAVGKKIPVSLEVVASDFNEMVREGKVLHKKFRKHGNVYVKIPVNPCLEDKCSTASDGIRAIKLLSSKGIKINCTLIFTPEQALLAAKAGANIVSPFAGREDDYIREMSRIKFEKEDYYPSRGKKKLGKILSDDGIVSGIDLVAEIKMIFRKQGIKAEVLAASIRNKRQFREAALAGADIATVPFSVIKTLLEHNKTSEGMRKFVKDIVPEYKSMLNKGRKGK
ncbi:transaldolase [Candidatus Pacearchaeota archaeon]|nr:transaldolase [Candidatus Pacearchaeota archaeon]|tara:strand:+ start:5072 stop:5899 length:828 start_codon:yes stop_codon:yes gene_type:complete